MATPGSRLSATLGFIHPTTLEFIHEQILHGRLPAARYCTAVYEKHSIWQKVLHTSPAATWHPLGQRQSPHLWGNQEAHHASDALVAPVAMHKQEALQVPKLRNGKVAGHDSLQHREAVASQGSDRLLRTGTFICPSETPDLWAK